MPESGFGRVPGHGPEQAARPLVGTAEQGGVIDPDVLWSCVSCGACVEQCPVDIEHVDHIIDMRRYQVMMESEFPSELSTLFKNLETKGNPWGQNASDRTNWISEVDFDVPVYGEDVDSFDGFEYLFWVGCAGAYDDKAKKTTKAVAELLAVAGVKYLVLGTGESCNGDSARRSGNEFLFQQLAQQAVETLDGLFEGVENVDRKIVVSCPHCFNTLGKEYRQLGANYSVLHHTQLLNRLVRDKKLVPVTSVSQDITYHDPCYLGRHNKVYEAPRELIGASGAKFTEMPRHAERSFCCGAGGARMWMEEHIGKRINHERVDEALATGAGTIATACPFCRVMVTDGVNDRQEEAGRSGVEVLDVAQVLLASLDYDKATLPEKGTAAKEASERPTSGPPKPKRPKRPSPRLSPQAHRLKHLPRRPRRSPRRRRRLPRPSRDWVSPAARSDRAPRKRRRKARPPPQPRHPQAQPRPEAKAPAAPVKGLGIAARRQATRRQESRPRGPSSPGSQGRRSTRDRGTRGHSGSGGRGPRSTRRARGAGQRAGYRCRCQAPRRQESRPGSPGSDRRARCGRSGGAATGGKAGARAEARTG